MDRDGVNQLPVMADGRVVGMLTREDVISFLRTLQELGPWQAQDRVRVDRGGRAAHGAPRGRAQ